MKRDMDLLRDLLLWMEARETEGTFLLQEMPLLGDRRIVAEHINILKSGGFLEPADKYRFRIGWEGHEFLDKVRNPEIWTKTKDVDSKVGSWSVKLLGELATGFIRAKAIELGLPLG